MRNSRILVVCLAFLAAIIALSVGVVFAAGEKSAPSPATGAAPAPALPPNITLGTLGSDGALTLGNLTLGTFAPPAAPPPPPPPAPADDSTIAVINGQKIERGELVSALMKKYGQDEFQELVIETLLKQQEKQYGVTATAAEIDAALDHEVDSQISQEKAQIERQYQGMVSWEMYLKQMGMTEADRRKKIRERLTGTPDDKEMLKRSVVWAKLAWYDYLKHDRVEVAQILVETEADAKKALQELHSGKDFGDVARSMSLDRESAASGGHLAEMFSEGDYKVRQDIPGPEFEHAAFALKVGEVSAPVQVSSSIPFSTG